MNSTSRLSCWLVMEALILANAQGETNPTVTSPPTGSGLFDPIPGIFESELPRMTLPANLRVTLRPRLSDIYRKDYLRLNWGLRYGLSPQWELSADVLTYVAHGVGDQSFLNDNGVAQLGFGAKYRFDEFLTPFWDAAVGFRYSTPINHPPEEITDDLRHISPYMTMEHVLKRHPTISGFLSFGFDFTTKAFARDNTDSHYGADTWFITPGFTWRRGPFKYTVEVTYTTSTGLDNSNSYNISLRPGMSWTLPKHLTFNSPNRWVLGLGFKAANGNGGNSFGVTTRLQTDFDFRRIFYTPKTMSVSRN